MKHLASIQIEFLKEARKWDDLSYEDQVGYLKRHPNTKRKITARPSKSKSLPEQKEKNDETKSDISKMTPVQQKIFDACEPLIKKLQDDAVQYHETILQEFEKYKKPLKDVQMQKLMTDFSSSHHNSEILPFLSSLLSRRIVERQDQ
jgi:hypothetical protein